jgi:cell division initiation protein
MRITPLDIRKQEFRRTMRGLDAEEVYAFLTTVADEYEAVLNDSKALKERLLELDDKVQEYRNMEKTLRNTLITAERVNAESKENARREAGLIVKEAQIEAEKALRSIRSEQMTLINSVRDLKRQQESYLSRVKMLAEAHLKFLVNAERDSMEEKESVEPQPDWQEDRVPPAVFPEDRQDHKPIEIANADDAADDSPEADEFRSEHSDRPSAPANESSGRFANEIPPADGEPLREQHEVQTEPLFPMPPAETPESDGVPDLNDILERLAERQNDVYTSAPPKGASAAPARPAVPPPPAGKTAFDSARRDQAPLMPPKESAIPRQEPAIPRQEPAIPRQEPAIPKKGPAMPKQGGEEWSLERLKRDILSGAAGDHEKT